MLLHVILLLAGLALILGGANYLTDGSVSVARRMGVTPLVIGLTVVAFGTSAPELAISITSAAAGNAPIAIGNVVGSNIFNVLVIIGAVALIRPINVPRSTMANDLPLVVLASVALLVAGNTPLLDGVRPAVLTRSTGILFLLFFAIFLTYTLRSAKSTGSESPSQNGKPQAVWLSALMIAGGLAALVYGGDLFVDHAAALARALNVSEAVIGLTIVAMGTSLPELATSIVAALKGQGDLAVGNVVGSSIFNIFMVLGCSATVAPLPFGTIGNADLLVMTGAAILFWLMGRYIGKRIITRGEGIALLAAYIAYTVYLISQA